MPVTYDECGPDEYAILGDLKRKYRDDLVEAGARIAMFFVLDTEFSNIPALMVRGKPAQGSAKVNSVGDRAEGKADATIRLDRFLWKKMTSIQRLALVHHELSHIGCPNPKKKDSLGRPILRPVHADWETDGFDEICQIYGDDAPEKINLNIIRERLRIQGLPFGDEDEVAADVAAEESAVASGMAETESSESPEPSDRWRSVPLSVVTKRLGDDAWHALNDEYELRTLEDVADFLRGGERLHELPLLGLDSAAVLAEDIDIHRCEHDDGSAQSIKAEWLADTLAAYRDNAIEAAKSRKAPKGKAKAKAQATA